jgi:hypothetical protein
MSGREELESLLLNKLSQVHMTITKQMALLSVLCSFIAAAIFFPPGALFSDHEIKQQPCHDF